MSAFLSRFWDAAETVGVDPIVRKEMYGVSRRWTTYLGRSFYVFLLGLVVWLVWVGSSRYMSMEYSQYARLGRDLFLAFTWTQFVLVVLAAAVQSSDMISKEVRQGTLGVLFLTPLTPARILLGKFKASFGSLLILILSGVPILSISVYLGGVTGFDLLVVTALTMVSGVFGVCFSLFVSTYFKGGAWGLVISIIGIAAYGLLPVLFLALADMRERDMWEILKFQDSAVMLGVYFDDKLGASTKFIERYSWIGTCLFMTGMSGAFLLLGAVRLKALAQADRKPGAVSRTFDAMDNAFDMNNVLGARILKSSREVWEHQPYLWKELHTRVTGKLRYLTRIVVALLILLVVGMLVFVDDLMDEEAMILPLALAMMPLFVLWAVGAGSGTFSKEREENKWDILMTLPIDPTSFVLSKLAGASMSVMPIAIILLVFLAFPLLAWTSLLPFLPVYLTTFLFCGFVIVMGMFYSMRCNTTRKAFALTLSTTIGILVGIPLALLIFFAMTGFRGGSDKVFVWILTATNPFLYLEWIDRWHRQMRYGYGSGSFPLSALIAFCVLYGSLSVGMLVHLVSGFDRMRHKE